MKNLTYLLITISAIGIIIGSFIFGRSSKECETIFVRPDTIFQINQPEIDRLQRWIKEQDSQIEFYIKQRDSLQLIIKNHEKVTITSDTGYIPAIVREWAEYQSQE